MPFLKKRFDDVVVRKSDCSQFISTTQLLKMEVYGNKTCYSLNSHGKRDMKDI